MEKEGKKEEARRRGQRGRKEKSEAIDEELKRNEVCRQDKTVRKETGKRCKEASVLGRRNEVRIQQWGRKLGI